MKRNILILASMLALLVAGAAFAQSTLNTTAPGPTQQQDPGQTNNNLPNPGNPVPARPTDNQPVTEQGTVEGTAAESAARTQGQGTTTGTQSGTTTGSMSGSSNLNQQNTGVAPETEQGEGMDVDVDTGSRASGAVDVDVTRTTDSDTDASGVNETGETGDMTTGQYSGDTDSLPSTASELPSVALLGLLFLGAAFALRTYQKRNA